MSNPFGEDDPAPEPRAYQQQPWPAVGAEACDSPGYVSNVGEPGNFVVPSDRSSLMPGINNVNSHLSALGLVDYDDAPLDFDGSVEDTARVVHCIHKLLQHRQGGVKERDDLAEVIRRKTCDYEALQKRNRNLQHQFDLKAKEFTSMQYKMQSQEINSQSERKRMQTELKDLRTKCQQLQFRFTQQAHQLKSKDKEMSKTTDKLEQRAAKQMGGQDVVTRHGMQRMDILNPLPMPGERAAKPRAFASQIAGEERMDVLTGEWERGRGEVTQTRLTLRAFAERFREVVGKYAALSDAQRRREQRAGLQLRAEDGASDAGTATESQGMAGVGGGLDRENACNPALFELPLEISKGAVEDFFQLHLEALDEALNHLWQRATAGAALRKMDLGTPMDDEGPDPGFQIDLGAGSVAGESLGLPSVFESTAGGSTVRSSGTRPARHGHGAGAGTPLAGGGGSMPPPSSSSSSTGSVRSSGYRSHQRTFK